MENRKIQFCSYCGSKLDDGARFCKNCGEPVSVNAQKEYGSKQEDSAEENPSQRKSVYEGYIHKCPNCGEVIEAFVTHCPSCGYEIRDTKSATSVRELAFKLEKISAQKMPTHDEDESVMKKVFGTDLKDKEAADKERRNFEYQKEKEEASLIINFSVPNTKEDMLEFMILAASNIDVKRGTDDVVSKAWLSKLEQVYQRAEISMSDHQDFAQIEAIYNRKMREIKNSKIRNVLKWVGLIAGWFFLLGLLWNPKVTIIIAIFVVFLILIGIILFKRT
ncbi:MAG: zinc ribbon domain-containing protein [Lachnospiraceae bacterium]|nr:zinc ribbon domain-containing protein [Lachnospiraceae bacterium]